MSAKHARDISRLFGPRMTTTSGRCWRLRARRSFIAIRMRVGLTTIGRWFRVGRPAPIIGSAPWKPLVSQPHFRWPTSGEPRSVHRNGRPAGHRPRHVAAARHQDPHAPHHPGRPNPSTREAPPSRRARASGKVRPTPREGRSGDSASACRGPAGAPRLPGGRTSGGPLLDAAGPATTRRPGPAPTRDPRRRSASAVPARGSP